MTEIRINIERLSRRPHLVVLALLMFFAACAQQGAQPSPTIEAFAGQWETALNTGDVEGIVALYTDDCRIMPPNRPLVTGREAARAEFGSMIDAGFTGKLHTIEAFSAADLGYRVGTYELNAPGGEVIDRGKYIEVWRNVGGAWKIADDIWNSDMPAAGSGATMIVTHEVEDFDHWLAAWQGEHSRHEMFAEHGVPGTRLFQSVDDPNTIAVLMDVTDMDAMQAFLSSPEGATAKAEDGVKDSTMKAYAEIK
jgi:ketosteroid isomerase-like protein